jgi:hypothetical protein
MEKLYYSSIIETIKYFMSTCWVAYAFERCQVTLDCGQKLRSKNRDITLAKKREICKNKINFYLII